MANHAYVYDCKEELDSCVILELVRKFNKERMNSAFEVIYEVKEELWQLQLSEDIALSFWIGTYIACHEDENGEIIEGSEKEYPAIEVCHCPYGRFMWWVDCELNNYLAYHLKGKMADDGVGEIHEEPKPVKYAKYKDYNNIMCGKGFYSRMSKIFSYLAHRNFRKEYPQIKGL